MRGEVQPPGRKASVAFIFDRTRGDCGYSEYRHFRFVHGRPFHPAAEKGLLQYSGAGGAGRRDCVRGASEPVRCRAVAQSMRWIGLVGEIYVRLLKMAVIPLIFVSIVCAIINQKSGRQLGRVAAWSLVFLLGDGRRRQRPSEGRRPLVSAFPRRASPSGNPKRPPRIRWRRRREAWGCWRGPLWRSFPPIPSTP